MTLGPDYFDAIYAAADDPWSLASRWYERRKYAVTVAALPREHYERGLEVGCSIGVLTALLAARCAALLAVDVSAAAVRSAAARTAHLAHVSVEQRQLPEAWPAVDFDLIVLSEVLYYLAAHDADELVGRAVQSLAADGTLIAVHWRHPVADYPRSGDEVNSALGARARDLGLVRTVRHEELDFVLDVYAPAPALSVAQAEGLA